MSESIRRHDLRAAGGQQIRVTVNGNGITAVLSYSEMSALKRARRHLQKRGWTVVHTSGLSMEVRVSL